MLPVIGGPRISAEEKEAWRDLYAKKRDYLREHLTSLCAHTNPTNLWNSIVRHRHTGAGAGPQDDAASEAAVESYDDLQLSFAGFQTVAYETLFDITPEESKAAPAQVQQERKRLFFAHSFLSPATFLGFARSDRDTVPAVPLYAFVAKRLLLFRLRAELEVAASVPPPLFGSGSTTASAKPSPPTAVGRRVLPCPPSTSSPLSNSLTQEDLEAFIADLVPHLRIIRDVPPWMLPYYLCHASRKFFFMCDTRQVGALSIDTVMKSDVFSELLRMFESDPRDAVATYPENCPIEVPATLLDPAADLEDTVPGMVVVFENDGNDINDMYTIQLASLIPTPSNETSVEKSTSVQVRRDQVYFNSAASEFLQPGQLHMDNWFSLPLMCRIYEHFTALDTDEDGVLTVNELANYSNNSFTRLAVERTFECHVPHSGSRHIMDYKTYLNFVIATEHAATRPAMKYIWSILDLDDSKTKINVSTLHCFCKELAKELLENGLMVEISAQSILSEIIDMINPEWHEWVTFADIERSGQQATVLPILLSYRNFFAYDCREQTAAAGSDEFTDSSETTSDVAAATHVV